MSEFPQQSGQQRQPEAQEQAVPASVRGAMDLGTMQTGERQAPGRRRRPVVARVPATA